MDLSKEILLIFCGAILCALCSDVARDVKCEMIEEDNFCVCKLSDGSGRFDLTHFAGKPTKAFFPLITGRNTNETYAYDPCVPFTKTLAGSSNSCNGVAGCRTIEFSGSGELLQTAKHDKVEFQYDSAKQQLTLLYHNGDVFHDYGMEVVLVCTPGSDASHIEMVQATDSASQFDLFSRKSCLVSAAKGGLSFGSVLCILFSVGVIVYIGGGAIYLIFFKQKPPSEAIPNKDFWLDFPLLVMDGGKFLLSGFKTTQATHQRLGTSEEQEDEYEYDDEHTTSQQDDGGLSDPSDGFKAVPV